METRRRFGRFTVVTSYSWATDEPPGPACYDLREHQWEDPKSRDTTCPRCGTRRVRTFYADARQAVRG